MAAAPCRSAAPSFGDVNQYGLSIDAELASDDGHALTMRFQNHDEFPQCDRCPCLPSVGGASAIRRKTREFSIGALASLRSALTAPGAELSATIFRSLRQAISATPPSRQSRNLTNGIRAVIALPIIGDERLAFDADFGEELLACGVIPATKNPGDGSPSNRVIGSQIGRASCRERV